MKNGDIPSDNIYLSSNDDNVDLVRLGYKKFWTPSEEDKSPSIKVLFDG